MPVILDSVNLDRAFAKLDPAKVIIINDLPNRTEADQDSFNWLIKEVYTSDMISMLPKCRCGELKGEHRVGAICDKCGTPVRQSIEDDIQPILWFRKPKGIKRLITPHTLVMLEERFRKRNFNVIQYLMDKSYTVSGTKPKVMQQIMADDLPRGYNSFIDNFYEIMDYLSKSKLFKNQKNTDKLIRGMLGLNDDADPDILIQMLKDHKDTIFCDYLPLPNRTLLVVEQSFSKNYVESHALGIHDALNTMRSIDRDHHDQKLQSIESRTARILLKIAEYMRVYVETNIQPKPGLARKHMYGTRANHTFRAVITSHDQIAEHDEIHVPWSAAIATFWQHLMSVLINPNHPLGGMSHLAATNLLMDHVEKYHPLIDEVFKDMIKNTRHGAIISLIQRNPSLLKGSSQRVRIPKIKTDPADKTVSMHDLIASAMNADYDGRRNKMHLSYSMD
jgi:hypothetical protein